MASGRARQLRLHAVHQAQLVWAIMAETPGDALQRFIESGELAGDGGAMPAVPLADVIAADIVKNGGQLIVDQKKFDRMLQEVTCGKP